MLSFQKVKAADDEITCFILVAETILLETNNIEMQIRRVKTGKSNERIKICNVAMRYIKEEKYKNSKYKLVIIHRKIMGTIEIMVNKK